MKCYYYLELYFTHVRIVGKGEVANKISSLLSSLGYIITGEKPNLYIVIGEIERALKFANKKVGLIFVSEDGEYIIPLKGESKGVSFISSIIADLLDSNLITTSRFSQKGLLSVDEFAWINALFTRNKEKVKELNKKLLERKRLYIYADGIPLITPEEYVKTETQSEADIIIGEGKCDKVILKPIKIIVGLYYTVKIPVEVLLYSIKVTLRSLFINENRVDVILTPANDNNIKQISRLLNAEHKVIDADTCEDMLYSYGGSILLKSARRAYGVTSCLAGLYL
mgnify:CR=1 FL=1